MKMLKYNEEQIKWLRENSKKFTVKELVPIFNEKFDKNVDYDKLYHLMSRNNINVKIEDCRPIKNIVYSQEQIDWVKDNIDLYYYKELCEEFNKKFNMDIPVHRIQYIAQRNGIKKTKLFGGGAPAKKYTIEQEEWLKEFASNYYIEEILEKFNVHFNTNLNYNKMYHLLQRLDIKLKTKNSLENLDKGYQKKYNEEQLKWIQDNLNNYNSRTELRNAYNKKFNTDLPANSFNHIIWRNKLKPSKAIHVLDEYEIYIKNNYEKYIKEGWFYHKNFIKDFNEHFNTNINSSWLYNTFKHRLKLPYPKVCQQGMFNPIGHEKNYGGEIYVKVTNFPAHKNANGNLDEVYNYRRKTHVLYEKYHNVKINDETHIVIHLDKNKRNFEKDNLYLISRNAYNIYSGTKFSNETLETKLNALKVSEIKELIKEMK